MLVLILIFVFGGIYSYQILGKAFRYEESKYCISVVSDLVNNARSIEKDFLLYERKKVGFLESKHCTAVFQYKTSLDSAYGVLESMMSQEMIKEHGLMEDLVEIKRLIRDYQISFEKLVDLYYTRGFKDHGLEGDMRESVHDLMDARNLTEKYFAYGLRRHEKDFMLRKDVKYQVELSNTANEFKDYYVTGEGKGAFEPAYVVDRLKVIDDYVRNFNRIVEIESVIGLTGDSGILGDMKKNATAIGPIINDFTTIITEKNNRLWFNVKVALVTTLVLTIVFSLAISIYFSRKVTAPLGLLSQVMKNVVNGEKVDIGIIRQISSKDEVGTLATSFDRMIANLDEKLNEISVKNNELERKSIEDKKRQWIVEGLSKFTDLLKHNTELELNDFYFNVLSELVLFTQSNQAGLFLIEPSKQDRLQLIASYAYNRRKFLEKEVLKGEGLLGTAWIEGEMALLTDIPENYINITSGLGHAVPRCLAIVPIKLDGEIFGMLEIASFNNYHKHEMEFFKKVAERIALTHSTLLNHQKNNDLLREALDIRQKLEASEEELRQNMEELRSTQEEMHRNNMELKRKFDRIAQKSDLLNQLISKVYDGILITDNRFQIIETNQHALAKLSYDFEDVYQRPINQLMAKDIAALLGNIENEPSYILNGISNQQSIIMKDKDGICFKVKLVVLNIRMENNTFYAFLFRTSDKAQKKIIEKKINLRNKGVSAN